MVMMGAMLDKQWWYVECEDMLPLRNALGCIPVKRKELTDAEVFHKMKKISEAKYPPKRNTQR